MGLVAVTTADEDVKANNRLRLNYGVHFKALRKVYPVTDHWVQVFDVRIPGIPYGDLKRKVPDCSELKIPNCHSARPVFIQIHEMYESMAREIRKARQHIIQVLPTGRVLGRAYAKRSLLPIGGWVLHGLFGTWTDDDLKPIKKHLKRIDQGMAQVARGLEVENQRLVGYMTLSNHRLENLVNITVNQQQAISKLTEEFNNVLGTTMTMERLYIMTAQKLSQYSTILNDLGKFQLGIEMLLQGMLTPILIDKVKLQGVLRAVRRHMLYRYPRTYLVGNRVADVYAAHNFVFGRQEEHLLIQMHLPVTPNLNPFILYEVETFPVAVDNQTDHITEIRDLPKYFAAADRFQFYILPTHVDSYRVSL